MSCTMPMQGYGEPERLCGKKAVALYLYRGEFLERCKRHDTAKVQEIARQGNIPRTEVPQT